MLAALRSGGQEGGETTLTLVERLVRLIRAMGYEPATPAEAREIIGLRLLR